MRNICEEFLEEQVKMWLGNYQEDLEDMEITQKDLDNFTDNNISDIVSDLMNNDYLWEIVDNEVRRLIDETIERNRGNEND